MLPACRQSEIKQKNTDKKIPPTQVNNGISFCFIFCKKTADKNNNTGRNGINALFRTYNPPFKIHAKTGNSKSIKQTADKICARLHL